MITNGGNTAASMAGVRMTTGHILTACVVISKPDTDQDALVKKFSDFFALLDPGAKVRMLQFDEDKPPKPV